jgi:hypothetical protein
MLSCIVVVMPRPKPPEETVAFNARLPRRLHEALKADAAAHRRSLNGMLIELLIARYEPAEPPAGEAARVAAERPAKKRAK